MELSLEEALDLCLELIGCGIVIGLLHYILHSQPLISILERML